jgi:hypothetical protein
MRGDARAVDAAHLAGAHAQRHAAAAEDDGVALHELGHLPGEQQVVQLRLVGRRLVTTRSSARATFFVSGVCSSRPPPTRLQVQRVGRVGAGQRHLQQAHVLLGGEHGARLGREGRRDQHLDELLGRPICAAVASSSGG